MPDAEENYKCLICGVDTGIPKKEPIGPYPYETFPCWISGAIGPLCYSCDMKIYGSAKVGG